MTLKPTKPRYLMSAAEKLQHDIGTGRIDPDCSYCVREFIDSGNPDGFAPSHRGSTGCRSGSLAAGGRNSHCTCDTCF